MKISTCVIAGYRLICLKVAIVSASPRLSENPRFFINANRFPSGINTSCFHGDFACSALTKCRSSHVPGQPAAFILVPQEPRASELCSQRTNTKLKESRTILVCLCFFIWPFTADVPEDLGNRWNTTPCYHDATSDHFTIHCIINFLLRRQS